MHIRLVTSDQINWLSSDYLMRLILCLTETLEGAAICWQSLGLYSTSTVYVSFWYSTLQIRRYEVFLLSLIALPASTSVSEIIVIWIFKGPIGTSKVIEILGPAESSLLLKTFLLIWLPGSYCGVLECGEMTLVCTSLMHANSCISIFNSPQGLNIPRAREESFRSSLVGVLQANQGII